MVPWDGCKAKQIASAPRTEGVTCCIYTILLISINIDLNIHKFDFIL